MRCGALILLLGLLAAPSVQAQAPAQPSAAATGSPPTRATHFSGPCRPWTDDTQFGQIACYVKPGFDPGSVAKGNYKSPECDLSRSISTDQRTALQNAYAAAPEYAKSRLCRLTKLFVVPQPPSSPSPPPGGAEPAWDSWGLWEPLVPPIRGKDVYIAVSESGLLPQSNPMPVTTAIQAENLILGRLLKKYSEWEQNTTINPRPPSYTAEGNPNARQFGVLDIILHELGHVLLADSNADDIGPRRGQPPINGCFETVFVNESWKPGWSKRPWVAFRERNGEHKKTTPTLSSIEAKIATGNYAEASQDIYDGVGGEFVSLFAGVSPEEDFVETYKNRALYDGGLSTLTMSFPGIPATKDTLGAVRSGGGAAAKVFCLFELNLLSPIP